MSYTSFAASMSTAAVILVGVALTAGGGTAGGDTSPASTTSSPTSDSRLDDSGVGSYWDTSTAAEPTPTTTSQHPTLSPQDRALRPPTGQLAAGNEWTLMGPRMSESGCFDEARRQPLRASVCFTLSGDEAGSEGWWFWTVTQS